MATTPIRLMTVEAFRQLPEPVGGLDYELRHGELVPVSRPKPKHHDVQTNLVDLLRPLIRQPGYLSMEAPFRAIPEHDLRAADVAFVAIERWRKALEAGDLFGAPDLVIEVLSPSTTASEMYDREQLCLDSGCQEFWVADIERRQVRVATPGGPARLYRSGQEIPLATCGGGLLAVELIFG